MRGNVVEPGPAGMHHDQLGPELPGGPAHPKVENGQLLFEVGAPNQDGPGPLQVVDPGPGGDPHQEMRIQPVAQLTVQMGSVGDGAQELPEGIRLFVRGTGPAQAGDLSGAERPETLGGHIQGPRPIGLVDLAVARLHQGRIEPLGAPYGFEAKPALVAQPTLIGGVVVHPVQPEDLVLAGLDRNPAPDGTIRASALDGLQVPGAGPESIWHRRQGAHRADLHGVAREVRAKRLVGEGEHLGAVAAVDELDERVPGDLLGEASAACAENAPLPIEHHQLRDRYRLGEMALLFDEAALSRAVSHRLILQGALSASVADRAVEGVVDQQELEDPLLGLLDHLRLGVNDHLVGDPGGARCGEHRSPRPLDLDQAHPAHPHRIHPLVPAEPGDVGAGVLTRLDEQRPGVDFELPLVDGDRHPVRQAGTLPREHDGPLRP